MDTQRVAGDRASAAVALLATAWVAVITVLDLVLPTSVVPDTLLALAPLIACSVLPPRVTAGFGLAAILLVVWSGGWNQNWNTVQQWIRLLDVVAVSTAAVLVAIVRVHREEHLMRLAAIAETAQRAILPTVPATLDGVHTASRYLSAAQDAVVGGDLYDCSMSAGYTRFIVGDVRGKGLAAVEHAARVIRAFRQAAAAKITLAEAASCMNGNLTPYLGEEEFVTALLLDLTSRDTITVASCGHPPAILVRSDGNATYLETPAGLPLGVGSATEQRSYPWAPGDRLLLYTDGLSEARDAQGEFLSLLDLGPILANGDVDEALDSLLARVRAHVARGALDDDLAVLLLENAGVREPAGTAS